MNESASSIDTETSEDDINPFPDIAEPYSFEPVDSEASSSTISSDGESDESQPGLERLTNTNW